MNINQIIKKWAMPLILIIVFAFAGVLIYNSGKKAGEEQAMATAQVEENTNPDKSSAEASSETEIDENALAKMAAKPEITIVYTNDVHSYINNYEIDENGNEKRGLTYGSVAAIKKEHESYGETVFLVDAGDNLQGNAYGGFDKGQGVIEIMDAAGYDVSAVGNHEFDYGMERALEIMNKAAFPYVSCNFCYAETGNCVLPAYSIVERNGVKVAFIGITTPDTITKSSPMYFQDENGVTKYDFCQYLDGQLLYDKVQDTIDEVKDQVDYVVALAHLGNEDDSAPYRSSDVIANTRGIDALIDGHSHMIVENQTVPNIDGKMVTITQTGCYLQTIGVMKLSEEGAKTQLIAEYDEVDEKAIARTEIVVDTVNDDLDDVIAINDNPLLINDAMNKNERLIRKMDTNISDFVTDSVYWYFNEYRGQDCDIAIANGGGLRSDIEKGDFSYLSAAKIQPFGNVICMVKVTGQDIKDMLEWSTRNVGVAEDGGLLHVAGARFVVDTTIESTVSGDASDEFISGPTGEYRVKDIEIYNRDTEKYEPLDLKKEYTVGGINYLLRNGGEGFTMLTDAELIVDYVNEDYLVCAEYAKAFKPGDDGIPHINNESSPLSAYDEYQYNYESPLGSVRMQIITQ